MPNTPACRKPGPESMDVHTFLAGIWYLLLGFILILYVITDGFDLGIGLFVLLERDETRRTGMMAGISGVWDANETWLVLFGGALFGAFPVVYAITLHALYIPVSAMLFGLVMRGIALEYRAHARNKHFWTLVFGGGSLVVALSQGYMLGGVIGGLPVEGGEYIGGMWAWFDLFSTVVAVGVAAGYALLGGTFLIIKTRGGLQAISRLRSRRAAWIMLAAAVCVTIATPLSYDYIAQRWFSVPHVFILALLPLAGLLAWIRVMQTLDRGAEYEPFIWSTIIFIVSFVGLAVSLYPYLVPPVIAIDVAASSSTTLVFMLAGIGMLLPVMLVYNGFQYLVFRGKIFQLRADPDSAAGIAEDGDTRPRSNPVDVVR
jgi:cytochrome d ubiquinol oxidase subunit II